MSKFKIDIHRISKDLKEVNNGFKKTTDLVKITGVSNPTVMSWEKEAPEVVELIYYNSKMFNQKFFELIDKKADLFPVFKLLKYYSKSTGKSIENVILKS